MIRKLFLTKTVSHNRSVTLLAILLFLGMAARLGQAAPPSSNIRPPQDRDVPGTNAHPSASAGFFPITFWAMDYWKSSPAYPKVISDKQYRLIKNCHFNLVMGGPLKQAEKFGLQCMSDVLTGELLPLWWTPHEAVTEKQRQRIIELVSSVDRRSPALWGYKICDEPGTVLYAKVKAVKQIIQSVDPARPVFINIHPGSDVAKFIAEVGPNLCAYDHYPIFEDGAPLDEKIPPGFDHANFLNDLAQNRKASLAAGLKFLPTILACGHYCDYEVEGVKYHRSYGHITEARLRWQAYSALAYNAGGIGWFLYFTYDSKCYDEAAIGADWRPTKTYYWLQKLNREVAAVGTMLQGFRSVGVYESDPVHLWAGMGRDELAQFNRESIISGVAGGLVTAGEFVDRDGNSYLVIVNRNVNHAITIQPRLQWQRIGAIYVFDRRRCQWGRHPVWKPRQKPPSFTINSGDGLILRLTLPQ